MTTTERMRLHNPHQPTGQWIRKDKRLAIYLRDGFACLVCGTDLHGADPFDVTLDHIKPQSTGGDNEAHNLFTCCRSCNSARGSKPLARFAPPAALLRIRRCVRRSLTRFRVLAKAIMAGKVGMEEALWKK